MCVTRRARCRQSQLIGNDPFSVLETSERVNANVIERAKFGSWSRNSYLITWGCGAQDGHDESAAVTGASMLFAAHEQLVKWQRY